MKRVSVIICILLCFVLTDKAHAQRCLPSTKGLRITAGMTDGFHTADKRNELGYHFGMGMDRYVNGCHKWVFGGEYLQKYYPYKDIRDWNVDCSWRNIRHWIWFLSDRRCVACTHRMNAC